jgi:hypothetical protein
MTLAEFAKGSTTFLVVIAAGFLSTTYVDRQFAAEPVRSETPSTTTAACIDENGSWKNWLWPNVPALSPKCGQDR